LGFDVLLTGFEPAEVDIIIEGIGDESEQPENLVPGEASGPPVSRLGDVWMLGKHILVCGDANGLHPKVVRQAFRLAFLSPDVTSAILEGRQPAALSLAQIPKLLPLSWTEHLRLLG